jgi:hypothetical protein
MQQFGEITEKQIRQGPQWELGAAYREALSRQCCAFSPLFFFHRISLALTLAPILSSRHVVTLQGDLQMKHTEVTTEAQFLKHSQAAKFHDVHPRTLDRWAERGIIPKPRVINGLKYYDVAALAAAAGRRG